MLVGLSKELRKLGLDSIEMKNENFDVTHYVDMARSDQRIVLSRDSRYIVFARELNKEQCIQIPSDAIENQVIHILQYFQLQIDQRQLNTRCVECNGNDFILANRFQMQLMRFGQLQQVDDGTLKHGAHTGNGWQDNLRNIQQITEHIMLTRMTFRGKNIKVKRVKPYFLYNKDFFYICDVSKKWQCF